MGFKTDTSFLRFLTMGAMGVQQVMRQLRAAGFSPSELERYCGSNKIWATKVKRLRLPDLLCVRTGLRLEPVEQRAKPARRDFIRQSAAQRLHLEPGGQRLEAARGRKPLPMLDPFGGVGGG